MRKSFFYNMYQMTCCLRTQKVLRSSGGPLNILIEWKDLERYPTALLLSLLHLHLPCPPLCELNQSPPKFPIRPRTFLGISRVLTKSRPTSTDSIQFNMHCWPPYVCINNTE